MTHIYVGKLTIISDNGCRLPGRCQAIILNNAEVLLIGPLATNFSENLIVTKWFSFKKMHLKISSGKCRPFCLGLNVLKFSTKVICILMRQAWVSKLRRQWLPVNWSLDNEPTTCWVLGSWELQWWQITMGQFHWMLMSVRNMFLLSRFKFQVYLNHWPLGWTQF